MLTENRKYNFIGELTLKRSLILSDNSKPKDDKVNWLFLNTKEKQFSFVYKIINPREANYNESFEIYLAFTMIEVANEVIKLNIEYELLRGQESIGILKLKTAVD